MEGDPPPPECQQCQVKICEASPVGRLHLLSIVFLPYLLWGAVRWPALWHVLPKFAYCPPFQHIRIQSSHWIKAGGAGTVFEDSIARHLI